MNTEVLLVPVDLAVVTARTRTRPSPFALGASVTDRHGRGSPCALGYSPASATKRWCSRASSLSHPRAHLERLAVSSELLVHGGRVFLPAAAGKSCKAIRMLLALLSCRSPPRTIEPYRSPV